MPNYNTPDDLPKHLRDQAWAQWRDPAHTAIVKEGQPVTAQGDPHAAYLRDMRKQYRARRDVFRNIVHWQHKANGYKIPAPLAWNYWRVARSAPPPF